MSWIFVVVQRTLGGGFADCLDALGAEHFMHGATLFHHNRLLQIGLERAVGGSL